MCKAHVGLGITASDGEHVSGVGELGSRQYLHRLLLARGSKRNQDLAVRIYFPMRLTPSLEAALMRHHLCRLQQHRLACVTSWTQTLRTANRQRLNYAGGLPIARRPWASKSMTVPTGPTGTSAVRYGDMGLHLAWL